MVTVRKPIKSVIRHIVTRQIEPNPYISCPRKLNEGVILLLFGVTWYGKLLPIFSLCSYLQIDSVHPAPFQFHRPGAVPVSTKLNCTVLPSHPPPLSTDSFGVPRHYKRICHHFVPLTRLLQTPRIQFETNLIISFTVVKSRAQGCN